MSVFNQKGLKKNLFCAIFCMYKVLYSKGNLIMGRVLTNLNEVIYEVYEYKTLNVIDSKKLILPDIPIQILNSNYSTLHTLNHLRLGYTNALLVLDACLAPYANIEVIGRECQDAFSYEKRCFEVLVKKHLSQFEDVSFDQKLLSADYFTGNILNKSYNRSFFKFGMSNLNEVIKHISRLKKIVRAIISFIHFISALRKLVVAAICLQYLSKIVHNRISRSPTPHKHEPPIGGIKVGGEQHDKKSCCRDTLPL